MAFKSPGIYFTEIDNTEYVNPTAEINTTVAIVGFAKKGPIGEPTEINSYSDFKSIFGTPIAGTYAGLAVRSVLSAGGTVLYVRIADESLASKSNVILKNGSKKVNGCLVVNNKNSITVDSKINGKIFVNGEVYASDIVESGSDKRKTVILRSPASGRFAVTDMLEQLNEGLKSQVGFTEYSFKTPGEDSYKVFKANVSTFTVKDENGNTTLGNIGPYFVNLGKGMSLENVVNSINSTISKGTNPYQIFKISENLINGFAEKKSIISDEGDAATAYINGFSGGVFKVGVKKSDSEKVTDIKINVKGAAQDKVTMQELADCINEAFDKQGVGICCRYIYNKNIEKTDDKSNITSAALLFFATDYMSFEILPVLDDEGTYAKSLFAPVLPTITINDSVTVKDEFINYTTDNTGKELPYLLAGKSYTSTNTGSVTSSNVSGTTVYYPVFNNGTEQNENGTEVPKVIPFNLAFEVGSSVQNSFESGLDTYFEAVAEKDTNTIVFKVKKTDDKFVEEGTTIAIGDFDFEVGSEKSNYEYLFTKYTGEVSAENTYSNLYTNIVDLNKKALGNLKRSYTGQKGIADAVEVYRGDDQRIYIVQKDSTDIPSIEDTTNGTYNYTLKDLFGEVTSEDEFERQRLTAGKDSVLLKVEGKMEIKPENEDMIIFTAKEFGSGTNNVGIEIFTSVSPIDETLKEHYINIYVDGIKKESWEEVSYNPNSDKYFVNLINDEVENGGSAYIHASVRKGLTQAGDVKVPDTASLNSNGIVYLGTAINDKSVDFSSLTEVSVDDYTSYDYRLGNDGMSVGDPSDLFLAAMNKETSGLANKDLYSWHILITPDDGQREEIQNAAIELCEYMEDAIYIADPPKSLSRDAVIKWHNGTGVGNRTTPLQSNYCCTYWPWIKVFNAIENKYQYVMPSLIMAAQFCKVDNNYAPWYAPAGSTNGYCSTALDLEVNSVDKRYPNKIDRDALYLDQNRINPFLKLRNGNILAYGEKTCQRKNSTLTKIHTRRMLIALKKELNAAIKGFIFQPTVGENINKIRSNVTSIMEEYKNKGAIDSYNVDTSMNTTETLQQDILYIAISCVPVGCIEQVEITFTLNKSAD